MAYALYRWRRLRTFLGVGIYVAVCLNLSMLLGAPIHAAVVFAAWVVMILVCAFTDRAKSPWWQRIVTVLIFWLTLVWPPVIAERFGIRIGNWGYFAWTIPVMLVAMWRSRLFVEDA